MKSLFITDPLETLDYPRDTSVALIKEFFAQKQEVFHLNFFDIQNIERLKVRKLLDVKTISQDPFVWSDFVSISAKEFQFIFHRKDPPVDELYKTNCLLFTKLPNTIVQINNPLLISTLAEKLIPLEFKNYTIPTIVAKSSEEVITTVISAKGETVAKPINLFSGYGIEFFNPKTSKSTLETFFRKFGPEVILQDYVPEAEQIGDLRVLTFNGVILGSFMRKAAPGKRLQNLHQGGSIQKWETNPIQRKGALEISNTLAQRGLYFLGIDFLGDRVSEINVTSPMGTLQVDQLWDTYCESIVYQECLKIYKERKQ